MSITLRPIPFNVLAFYDTGQPELSAQSPLGQEQFVLLRQVGACSIRTLLHSTFKAAGINYPGSSSKQFHPAAQAAIDTLRCDGYDIRGIHYPPQASEATIEAIQDGLRAGMLALRTELGHLAPGAPWEYVQPASGELYIPPEPYQIGTPWVPDELQAKLALSSTTTH